MIRALYGQAQELPASLFNLGIGPYINASIIVSVLLSMPKDLAPWEFVEKMRAARKVRPAAGLYTLALSLRTRRALLMNLTCFELEATPLNDHPFLQIEVNWGQLQCKAPLWTCVQNRHRYGQSPHQQQQLGELIRCDDAHVLPPLSVVILNNDSNRRWNYLQEGKGGEAFINKQINNLAFAFALYFSVLKGFELAPYAIFPKFFVVQTAMALIAGEKVQHCAVMGVNAPLLKQWATFSTLKGESGFCTVLGDL